MEPILKDLYKVYEIVKNEKWLDIAKMISELFKEGKEVADV